MLTLSIDGADLYNEARQEFCKLEPIVLRFEHSLASVSKWEAFYKKPFLSKDSKTFSELIRYFQYMCLNEGIDPLYFTQLSSNNIRKITEYIGDSMTATTIHDLDKRKGPSKIITSEVIYYWMVSLQIPFECQYWHFNRLMMLINVINHQNAPSKKMSKREIFNQNRMLNEQRRKQLQTNG